MSDATSSQSSELPDSSSQPLVSPETSKKLHLVEKLVGVPIGLLFFILVAFLLVRNDTVDPSLQPILRSVSAFMIAVLAGLLSGFVLVDYTSRNLKIRAGGSLGIFVIAYLFSPVTILQPLSMQQLLENAEQLPIIANRVDTRPHDVDMERELEKIQQRVEYGIVNVRPTSESESRQLALCKGILSNSKKDFVGTVYTLAGTNISNEPDPKLRNKIYRTLAEAYHGENRWEESLQMLSEIPNGKLTLLDEIRAAWCLKNSSLFEEALRKYDRLVDRYQHLVNGGETSVLDLSSVIGLRADLLSMLGEHETAIADFDRAIEMHRKHGGYCLDIARLLSNRALSLVKAGQSDLAEDDFVQAYELFKTALEGVRTKSPRKFIVAQEMARSLSTASIPIFNNGNRKLSEDFLNEALDLLRPHLSSQPVANRYFAAALVNRGVIQSTDNDLDEAIVSFSESIKMLEPFLTDSNNDVRRDLTLAYGNRADVFQKQQKFDIAIRDYRKSKELDGSGEFQAELTRRLDHLKAIVATDS